jgi:arylsulfatase
LNDSLIIFASDNGGCAEEMNPRLRGLHVPEKTRQGCPVRFGNEPSIVPGPEDTYASYGVPWANLSNTPFRWFKQHVHEGGIASPLIAHWPSGIASRGGFSRQVGHIIDLMPTCLELAGARYPTEFRDQPVLPCEGRSLVPAFEGKAPEPRNLFWEHRGNRAVLKDQRKLVSLAGKTGPAPWELYGLRDDRTEMRDQAAGHPDEVAELERLYEQWADRCGVMPWDSVNDRPLGTDN